VVLEADKRFKTIAAGLDPNTFKDLRRSVRGVIADFWTSSEREIAGPFDAEFGQWIGTRFWFYPESIRIETDFDSRYARIANARFTADAGETVTIS
jgi:hypothetical protein